MCECVWVFSGRRLSVCQEAVFAFLEKHELASFHGATQRCVGGKGEAACTYLRGPGLHLL